MQLLGFPRCHLSSTMSRRGHDHCGHHGCCGCGRGDYRVHRGRVPMDARTQALPCHLPSPCKRSKTCAKNGWLDDVTHPTTFYARVQKKTHHITPIIISPMFLCTGATYGGLNPCKKYRISNIINTPKWIVPWLDEPKKKLTWKAGPPLCPPLVGRVLLAATRHVWRKAPNMTTTISKKSSSFCWRL